jgi:hypothetical protein
MRTIAPRSTGEVLSPVEDDTSSAYIRQVPETEFEQELLKRVLQAEGAFREDIGILGTDWRASISRSGAWSDQGRYCCWLIIEKGETGPFSFIHQEQFPIFLWVAERPSAASPASTLVAGWDLPQTPYTLGDQSNDLPYMPVLGMPLEAQ